MADPAARKDESNESGAGADLTGKVALVTGGASGIGLATARRLRHAGASVVLVDTAEGPGRREADALEGLFISSDVSDPGAWPRVVEATTERFGGIDLAHLNAGLVTPEADVTLVSDDAYRKILGVNVDGVFLGIRAVVPAISRRGGGAIVATASLAGLIAYSPDPIYAMTKAAVVGLVRALAPQLAERHITVNAVCPGLVDTPLLNEEAKAMVAEAGFPLIAPEAIAETVLHRMIGPETGLAWVCQAGRPAIAYRFAGVPGPAGAGAGRPPPARLAAHDQTGSGRG